MQFCGKFFLIISALLVLCSCKPLSNRKKPSSLPSMFLLSGSGNIDYEPRLHHDQKTAAQRTFHHEKASKRQERQEEEHVLQQQNEVEGSTPSSPLIILNKNKKFLRAAIESQLNNLGDDQQKILVINKLTKIAMLDAMLKRRDEIMVKLGL